MTGKASRGGKRVGAGRKPSFKKASRLTFNLEEGDLVKLQSEARRQGVTVSELLRKLISVHLGRKR